MVARPRTSEACVRLRVIAVWLLLAATAPVHAAARGKVVLFVMDRVTLQDLMDADLPHVKRLLEQGAVGLMNPLGARGPGNMRVAMTINVGTRADADELAGEVLEGREIYPSENAPARVVHHRRTGVAASPDNLVNVHLREMMDNNLKSPHQVVIGTLGDLAHQAGGRTAALGNSDTVIRDNAFNFTRYGALMAMDSGGTVDKGSVGERLLEKRPDAPYGVRTHAGELLKRFRALHADPQVSLIIVDCGDTYRADVYSFLCTEDVGLQHKQAALQRADALMGNILRALNPQNDLLIALSLSVPRLHAGEMLPVMAWGQNIQAGTYLTSGSTKRRGFITPADVTATVAQFVSATLPSNVLGKPVSNAPTAKLVPNRLESLLRINRLTVVTDRGLRFGVFVVFALLESLALVSCVLAITFSSRVSAKVRSGIRTLLTLTALLPFVIHFGNAILPLHFTYGAAGPLLVMVPLAIYFAVARFVGGNNFQSYLSFAGVALLFVCWGTDFGSEFNTIFGYSSYYGGRYYGLGNATTSLLLGWGIASWGFLQGKVLLRMLVMFLILTVFIAFPQFGADAGGAVGAVATFAPMWLVAKGVRLSGKKAWRSIATLVLVLVLVVALIALLDVRRAPEDRTHLGRLVAEMQAQGAAPFVDMFVTKARVWGRTFGHWHWDVCLGTLVVTTAWLLIGLRHRLVPLLAERPTLNALLYGGTIGTVVTFLLNDSGPLIAGLMGLYVLSPPLYLLLKEETT